MITFVAAVVIGTEAFKEYEKFKHRSYTKQGLAKRKESAKESNTKWLSEEDFWDGLRLLNELYDRISSSNIHRQSSYKNILISVNYGTAKRVFAHLALLAKVLALPLSLRKSLNLL